MIEEQQLREFARQIRADVADRQDQPSSSLGSHVALAEYMLGALEESGEVVEPTFCPFEDTAHGRCQIIAFSLDDDTGRLTAYTAHFDAEDEAKLPAAKVGDLVARAGRFVRIALSGVHDRFASSPEALDAARAMANSLHSIVSIRIVLLTNAHVSEWSLPAQPINERPVDAAVYDLARLFRMSQGVISRDQIEIDFVQLGGHAVPCLEVAPQPAEYQTFLLILRGDLVYKLYQLYGQRLMEFNVRSFLQAKGSVNRGIRDTLSNSPERFLAYNNGVAATADEIMVGRIAGETCITKVRGLQIVNGGQTVASIHQAGRKKDADLSKVAVAMKLTKVDPEKLEEFVPLIARYANTQNSIQVSDLSANRPFHIAIERFADEIWCPGEEQRWFYERARGAYQIAATRYGTTPAKRREFRGERPPARRFTKTDLAKYLMTWDCRPHDVSRGAQKNFTLFMAEIDKRPEEERNPDEAFFKKAVALAILFKSAQAAVQEHKFGAYGANIVAYLVAVVSHKAEHFIDAEMIWDAQAVSEAFFALLKAWAPLVRAEILRGAEDRNVTEWCKKPECWRGVMTLSLAWQPAMPPELVRPKLVALSTEPDHETKAVTDVAANADVQEALRLDAAGWADVVEWGTRNRGPDDFAVKVASTLVGYALRGWAQMPSEKQAKCVRQLVHAAAAAGAIDLA